MLSVARLPQQLQLTAAIVPAASRLQGRQLPDDRPITF